MKILIVDDNGDVRDILKRMIEMQGHTAIEANDGQEGIDKITSDKPNLIITDTMMPRMDGFQFLRNIKSNNDLKSIPVVVYSGIYSGSKDRELALTLGASAFITKPHRPEIFWEEIHSIINNIQDKNPVVKEIPIEDEDVFLRNYSRIVTAKLEEKVKELEREVFSRKHSEEILAKSEKHLRAIIDAEPECVKLLDSQGVLLDINASGLAMAEADSPEQVIGRPFYPVIVPEHREAFKSLVARVFRGESGILEHEIIGLKGARRCIEAHLVPLRDAHNTVTAALSISRDITWKKHAASALQKSETLFKTLFESNPDGIFIVNREGHIVQMNKQGEALFGYNQDELINTTIDALVPESFREKHSKYRDRYFAESSIKHMGGCLGVSARRKDGSEFSVDIMLSPLHTNEGMYAICVVRDVSTRVQMEQAMRRSETRLTNAQRIAHLGNWEWSIAKNDLWWSEEIYRIFGIAHQAFGATYEAFMNAVHPDDREFVRKSVDLALQGKAPYSINHRIVLPDGSERIVHEQAEVVFDAGGKAIQMNGTVQDVTEFKQAEEEIKKLFTAIDQSINTVFITDVKGNIEYVNPMFEQVTGYTKKEALGQNPHILASGETAHTVYEELWNAITTGKTWRGIFKNRKKNGHYYWGSGLITPIRNENGQITHFLAVQEDITDKMRAEERIEYLVSYDELTSLINRARFVELLGEWITGAKTSNQPGTLLLIDIDGFRLINDTHGHSTGDTVLVHIAKFLDSTLSEIDGQYANKAAGKSILSRLGGDEFALFLPGRNEREGMEAAEEIRKRLVMFKFPEISGYLTASIGMVVYPRDGNTTKELITKADASVYHAKEMGHNTVHLYCAEDLMMEKLHSRMEWKGRIQKAIEENRFEPWFQPILDLRDNQVHHYEALARKRGVHGEIILPGSFVDAAENMGLITAIDRIIIRKALFAQSLLRKQGRNYSFSMNLSGKDLDDKSLLDFLRSAITETGADPKSLIFEITETSAVRDFDRAVKFIGELRSIGCCFSLDDFGVGFTSFKYLKEMQVDYIKIDGSFIRKLNENMTDRLFVRAMATVARGMGVKTIAEFVENSQVITILREFGVDYGQGYFIGRPAPNI